MKKLITKEDKIFIAGHKGMVGRSIKKNLISKNYTNLITVEKNDLNLLDDLKVKNWFKKNKPDIVILAAAKVGGIMANNKYPANFILENLKIQTNVIEASWENNIKRFLFLGSSCIYPKYANQPINEEELLNGYLEPTNQWYAIAKIAGIKLCEALRKQYDFDAISLMPTNLYGPGDNYDPNNSHVLPSLIRKFYEAKINNLDKVICWGTGYPMREFLHVDDLSEASIYALENWYPKKEELKYMNVGTGKDISIRELATIIAKEIGFEGEIEWDVSKPDGTPKKQLNISKFSKLGWSSKIKLSDGIKNTIDCYINENKKINNI
ncbi:GDP-L-fucose synthase family protein [Prochlorococcus marinus]|uniref:GDP-L-fucose synthase n=1 Tax=Prochlorococcus marinus (strain AS9601) TaxID=146891 RepID=A2BSC3_PROMS|nr:GDP-L-fucose synthase [Prochlorococcus marinus]ABM70684.1 Putative fucose synthetase [Prochlorococcus marinus str. AS9601]